MKNMKMTETPKNRQTSGRCWRAKRADCPKIEHSKNTVTVKTKRKTLPTSPRDWLESVGIIAVVPPCLAGDVPVKKLRRIPIITECGCLPAKEIAATRRRVSCSLKRCEVNRIFLTFNVTANTNSIIRKTHKPADIISNRNKFRDFCACF